MPIAQPESKYERIHAAWADFKDIADSKFRRLGGAGAFPPITELGTVDKDVITDSYEAEGMHIDLIVQRRTCQGLATSYNAVINVTPTTAAPAK